MPPSIAVMTYDELLQHKLALHQKYISTQQSIQRQQDTKNIPRLYGLMNRLEAELKHVYAEVGRRQMNT
jgi:hypothetical protein